jgi:SAM-dependent methyltransferase
LSASMVNGKSILDLGCCLGATGHWCLSHGASHYTGVEIQEGYVQAARRLLEKYHAGKFFIEQIAIEQYLANPPSEPFDIVCVLGVLYAFTDYYSILKGCAEVCRSILAVEGLYPSGYLNTPDFCGVQFRKRQLVNLADKNASAVGRGTRISPSGLKWLMAEFGFRAPYGIIKPRAITDVPDIYNRTPDTQKAEPVRYLMRFERTPLTSRSVSQDLLHGVTETENW